MTALLPNPTPPQVRALASVLSNLIRDSPPAPADPGQQELVRDGRDPVRLHRGAWYRRPAMGEPAGCPACGSREALLLPAAGDQRRDWCKAFGDLALARLRPIGALGLAPPSPPRPAQRPPTLGASTRPLPAPARYERPFLPARRGGCGPVRLAPSRLRPPARQLRGVAL